MSRKKPAASAGKSGPPDQPAIAPPDGSDPRVAEASASKWIAISLAALLLTAGALVFWLSRDATPQGSAVVAASAASAAAAAAASGAGTVTRVRQAYVDNQLCVACHEDAARKWQQSHHFMAMAVPSDASVRGDFANTSFRHEGVTSRFFRRDGRYFVNTDGPDGRQADFEIRYTFGVDPLQQYLIELPGGRLQALTIAWDTNRKRCFHL